ncbi:MAG: DUF4403 family protein [Cyclobacteriaceae bacterium]|nr:DUF4403 family protein [Cyclobacteriaceae bacterium HetDA_MAG_MS6]
MRITKKIFLILLIGLVACQKETRKSEEYTEAVVPPSYFSTKIKLPANRLQEAIGQTLPRLLLDNKIKLNKQNDSLKLTIVRRGGLDVSIAGEMISTSIPLSVSSVLQKKVFGITVSNEDNPVIFAADVKMDFMIRLEEDWNISFNCSWQGLKWIEKPVLDIMGFQLSIEDIVEEQIANNREILESVICKTLNRTISTRNIFDKVWQDLQKNNAVTKVPFPLYLTLRPEDLKAKIFALGHDTLSIQAIYQGGIHIWNRTRNRDSTLALPLRQDPVGSKEAFSLYADLRIPYAKIQEIVTKHASNYPLSYKEYSGKIEEVQIHPHQGRIGATVITSGDLKGKILVTGIPYLTHKFIVGLKDIEYEILEADQWMRLTDLAIHSTVKSYLKEMLKYDASEFFQNLDRSITQGISKSKLANKMDIQLYFDHIELYDQGILQEELQLVCLLEGKSSIILKNLKLKK